MDNEYTPREKANRWIYMGVIPTFIPIIIAIVYDFYLEYTVLQIISRHFLDLILIIFAIAVSIYSTLSDVDNKVAEKKKEKQRLWCILFGLVALSCYSFLYEKDNETVIILWVIRIVVFITAGVIIYMGYGVEYEKEELEYKNKKTYNSEKNKKDC